MNEYRTFPSDVEIADTLTGEIRIYKTDQYEWMENGNYEWSDYIWSEGNFACDHNRVLFFNCSGDEQIPEDVVNCITERFKVLSITDLRNGKVIYSEQ